MSLWIRYNIINNGANIHEQPWTNINSKAIWVSTDYLCQQLCVVLTLSIQSPDILGGAYLLTFNLDGDLPFLNNWINHSNKKLNFRHGTRESRTQRVTFSHGCAILLTDNHMIHLSEYDFICKYSSLKPSRLCPVC